MKAFILIAAVIAFSAPVFAQTSANDAQIVKLPRIEVVAKRKSALTGQTLTSVKKINLPTPYST
ncbi:MAG: hypothetical protein RL571_827 [Pseudomonadota bacterium]|jgi:hypothetical protein